MAEEKEIYIVSVAYGYVLAWQSTGSPSYAVVQVRDSNSKAQRWVVEPSEEKNVVALRNAANGEYLNCQEAKNFGKVAVGAKQLWRIDSPDVVHAPGGVRLQPLSFDKYFLNHDGPHKTNFGDKGQKAHMWQWEQRWEINEVWYLNSTGDFDALAAATGQGAASGVDFEKKMKDLEIREATLSSRESDAQTKEKELRDGEAELARKDSKQQEDLRARQKELDDREGQLASHEAEQKREVEEATKRLQEQEAALAKRETSARENEGKNQDSQQKLKDVEAREQALAAKEKDDAARSKAKEEDLRARETALAEQEKQVYEKAAAELEECEKRNRELEERERRLKDREAEASKPTSSGNSEKAPTNHADTRINELQKRENDLDERERRVKERESEAKTPHPTTSGEKEKSDSRANQSKPRSSAQHGPANDAPVDASTQDKEKFKAIRHRLDRLEKQIHSRGAEKKEQERCGHVICRPPRKIERRVVGYVYGATK
ncbi:hypothetical protein LTR62_002932 [Meristemomyces frigidus]|uniref:Uncharacterized protein n=1 Tax=Meristemomyces frigidus TaxID=1508187 RepID=A0AAN7TS20_9PEZI|nr:hypothetical protein LTR62_002932 [Meristemomyces frigidus]